MKKLKNLTKLDLLFIVFILSLLIKDISIIITNLIESPDPWFYSGSFRAFEKSSTICQISSDTTSTTTYIYNSNDSWANAIRSIFIYGIAASRFNLASTPRARTFIVVGSLVLDSMMRVLSKIINNPNYIVELVQNWRSLWTRSLEFLDSILFFFLKKKETATADKINNRTNFWGESELNAFYDFLDSLSLIQELALINSAYMVVVTITVLNIYSVVFSNEILKYFNIEEKYPRLQKFFVLRRTYQRYYLSVYGIMFILFTLFIGGLNLLTLAIVK